MPKARSKDPLLAATTSILLPALKPLGFQRKGNRELDRVRDGILHFVTPWYSGWGGRDFYVEYGAMPLVPPTDFLGGSCGNRLWDDVNRKYTWAGQTHDLADASMQRVVKLVREQIIPFFASIETNEQFLALLQQRSDPDHHEHFRVACCLARLRRLDEAKDRLHAAIRGYAEDGREWCPAYAGQCEQLLKAINDGSASELLEKWKTETIHNLKLEKIVSNGEAT